MKKEDKDWQVIKAITGLNLEQKVFEFRDLPQSYKHEDHVEEMVEVLKKRGLEVYDTKGHQIMTSDGLYFVAHKSEIGIK